MNPVIKEIFETKSVRHGQSAVKIIDHITLDEGLFLQNIIEEIKPQITLEIGLAFGVSALFISEALTAVNGEKHIAVDPFQNGVVYQGIGLENLKKGGFESVVKFYEKPSYLALPELIEENIKIDFAFIDGNHVFDYAMLDFFYIDLLLNTGGIVVFDDADFNAVHKLCRYVVTNRSYEVYRCFDTNRAKQSLIDKMLYAVSIKSYTLKSCLKPEITNPDWLFGITNSRCVAMRKLSNDNRPWDFYSDF